MLLEITKGFIIPGIYLIMVLLLKKFWLNKKYDKRKSSIIADSLNAALILYFLLIADWVMVMFFIVISVSRYNYYNPRVKKK